MSKPMSKPTTSARIKPPKPIQKVSRQSFVIQCAITAVITIGITIAVTILSATGSGFASDAPDGMRRWTVPIVVHLATVVPAFFLGGAMLVLAKGTRTHRILGRVYVALMLVTATATIFIGHSGSGIGGSGFSFLHLFTVNTFLCIPYAVWAARTGRIVAHRSAMQGMYIGLCIAGLFSMLPGRLLQTAMF